MAKREHVGYCKSCGVFLWEQYQPTESRLGSTGVVMLGDGSLMSITLCDACCEDLNYDALWINTLAGWTAENADAYAAKQSRKNLILGLLYTLPSNTLEN